jgi:hypothetical protein
MGLDWPLSPVFLALLASALLFILIYHGRGLLRSTMPSLAWKLLFLRGCVLVLLLFLIARPYLDTEEPDSSKLRLLNLIDLSGSMDVRDDKQGPRRIEEVRPFLDWSKEDSWLALRKSDFGKVENLGFSKQIDRLNAQSWTQTELGRKTALGDALSEGLAKSEDKTVLGSVVVFSDGMNNHGQSFLEVAKEYRSLGIPVNVVGVGSALPRGDLRIAFDDRKPNAVAKEELILQAEVENQYGQDHSTILKLLSGEELIEELSLSLKAGEKRRVSFSPYLPKVAGPKRFRLEVDSPNWDSDPSNDSDSLLVMVSPPEQFSLLYLSSQARPLYPFVKRVLGNEERFELNALVRLGEKVFHAFGEKVKPNYPTDPEFWMTFDAILMDLDALPELNATVVSSLKDFVQKRGGGLLFFGALQGARERLGGLIPAKTLERVEAKGDLSLSVLEEPLFGPEDEVEDMKPFLPGRLPGYFVKEQNQGARGVVVSKANGKPVLSVQAYGAGKVGYWGVPHDWRRSLADEDGAKEFRKFWQALAQWLGEGGEDRLKIQEPEKVLLRGVETPLRVEALGSDFEPSTDALVKAEVIGPDGFSQSVQLYPEGSVAGQYAGSFRPVLPGSYEVSYALDFPDGETLSSSNYLRVSETGEEAKNLSYAERELKTLAKLTGGEFLPISQMNANWAPTFAENLPVVRKRRSLADIWPVFIALFLAAGIEWIMRRQAGLK